jgi:hypothetical protein
MRRESSLKSMGSNRIRKLLYSIHPFPCWLVNVYFDDMENTENDLPMEGLSLVKYSLTQAEWCAGKESVSKYVSNLSLSSRNDLI